ncbi:S1C family serine protease [Nocardioides terrisoli]|uniref:S1C family serine protease n=1 Tax=Nocardioides terrisoli TaxID=3388267 RepID=UPI00287B824A|nr:trypsin-like peptidase domain-containing protein [Nocardioides marmorisolisilvae]
MTESQGDSQPTGIEHSAPGGARNPEPSEARLPVWVWPMIAVVALLLGLSGGAFAGYVVAGHRSGGDTPGGVLKVQRRTVAPLPADNSSIPSVAKKVLPSTVQIIAEYDGHARGATGSGWVFDKQGHIITNNHVVAQAAADHGPIEVIDQRGRHFSAKVIGRSAVYDVAVLEAKAARSLRPAAIGSADQMNVGETVVAIGSPLGLSATVTSGIVSAVHRPVTTGDGSDSSYISAIQTDAAINPGNSGGPLVDLQGQVVGVNSAIASLGTAIGSDESGNIGVGFAIPIEQVETTTDQILRTGRAEYPVIGAGVRGTTAMSGARVESVTDSSPAARSGLRPGDLITALDGEKVTGSIDLVVAIRTHVPGDTVTLTIERNGHQRQLRVKLAAKTG